MKKNLWTYLLCWSCLALSGCPLLEEKVKIYPTDGDANVPVNAIITVYIKSSANVTKEDVKSNLLSLSTCERKSTSSAAIQDDSTNTSTTQKDEKENEDKEEKTQTVQKTSVGFYLHTLQYQEASETQTTSNKSGLYMFLVPKGIENSDTPLEPGTTYCVTMKAFKNKSGDVIPQATTSFTTEEVPSFLYSDQPNIQIPQDEVALQNDYIIVDFQDTSVAPYKLLQSASLCQQSSATESTGPCKNFGKEIGYDLFMFEDLIRGEKDKFNMLQSNLFSFTPAEDATEIENLRLVINSSLGVTGSPDDDNIYKTMEVTTNPKGADTLNVITKAPQRPTLYKSFKVGSKITSATIDTTKTTDTKEETKEQE